jgi:hypothetical protein
VQIRDYNIVDDFLIRLYNVYKGVRPKDYLFSLIKSIFKKDVYVNKDLMHNVQLYYRVCEDFIIKDSMIIMPITLNKYSLIFNLYLNVIDIKED